MIRLALRLTVAYARVLSRSSEAGRTRRRHPCRRRRLPVCSDRQGTLPHRICSAM